MSAQPSRLVVSAPDRHTAHPLTCDCVCPLPAAPTANTVAAAEHGIALLCALARNVAQADGAMKQGRVSSAVLRLVSNLWKGTVAWRRPALPRSRAA